MQHAGSTHDSNKFQASAVHDLLKSDVGWLPEWACLAAANAFGNKGHGLTPYSRRGISKAQDTYKYYLSGCCIAIEHTFGMLVGSFGILWSLLRHAARKATLVMTACCRLQTFNIDRNGSKK